MVDFFENLTKKVSSMMEQLETLSNDTANQEKPVSEMSRGELKTFIATTVAASLATALPGIIQSHSAGVGPNTQDNKTLASVLQMQQTGVSTTSSAAEDNVQSYFYNGRFHSVPEGFVFPICSLRELHELWHFGLPEHSTGRIRPLKDIKASEFSIQGKDKNSSRVYTNASLVMKYFDGFLPQVMQTHGYQPQQANVNYYLTLDACARDVIDQSILDAIKAEFSEFYESKKRREIFENIKHSTFYSVYYSKRHKKG